MRKVALRGILDHKMRLLATFLAVALGVAFIGGVRTLTDTMNQAFDDLFADVYRDTDAVVRSAQTIGGAQDGNGGGEVRAHIDASVLDVVAAAPGVAQADGSVGGYARIIDKDGEPVGDPAMGAPTFGGNWSEVDDLNPFDLTGDSRAPQADDEIVIDRASAKSTGYELGDTVPVQTQAGVDDFTLVGIARFGTADSPGGASYVLWTTAEAQRLIGEPGRFDSVSAVADDGVSQTELRDSIAGVLADDPDAPDVEVLTGAEITAETQSDVKDQLSGITVFFTVFAVIALFVGTFVIYNSFSIIVAQRTREMALLRAIGASRRQVRRAVIIEAVVVGLVGSAVGFLLGLLVATALYRFFDLPEGALVILPASVLTAALCGLSVTVGSALVPARRAARVPPLAAMRDVAVDTSGRSRVRFVLGLAATVLGIAGVVGFAAASDVARVGICVGLAFLGVLLLGPGLAGPVSAALGVPLRRLRGVTGRLASENAGRNPRRTSATAQALMIGVGIVAFFFVINASIRASIDHTLDESFAGDFVIDSGTFGMVGLPTSVARDVSELPDVAHASPVRFAPAVVDGDETAVVATDAEAFDLLGLTIVDGSGALDPGEIVLDADTARHDHLAVGDEVPIRFVDQQGPDDSCSPGRCVYRVGGIYDTSDAGADVGAYVMNLDDYDAGVPDATDAQVFVQLADGVSVDEAQPELQRIVDPYVTADVQSVDDYKEAIGGQLDVVLNLILGLLALAIVIALLGIANTVALSILERTRELGLLRAVGMSRRQLRSAIRWESAIISLFGTALGLALGILGGWGIVAALGDEGFNVFRVPFGTLVGISVIAGLLGMLAAVGPAWRASRLDVLDAIESE
ncbi:MAG TPA: FtsX-like permease family protein [Acidimicrobiales bacterium]